MGRHSIPDPEDSAGEEHPEEPQTERFGHAPAEQPDYGPGFGEPGYREPEYREQDYDEPEYAEYPEYADNLEPERDYPEPELRRSDSTFPPRASGAQQGGDWEGGEWTGSHRAVTTGRRGVSLGVIAALVTVVVVVGGIILWRFFGDALSNRSDGAAARCVDGELAVAVVVDPSIADQVQALANNYNQAATPVGDRCVKVGVKAAGPDQVVNGFISKWPAELGERPALWIPPSSVSEARLEAAGGAQTRSGHKPAGPPPGI